MASMLTIRRLAQRQSVCRVIPQLYSIRRAAFSSIATGQESMVDQGSPDLTQSKKTQTPSNYKPLPKVDKLIPKEPHSRLVSLYNLPSTATKEDILRLARMAFHNVDTTIEESKSEAQSIHYFNCLLETYPLQSFVPPKPGITIQWASPDSVQES
jgi:hypothetical protein